MDPHSKSSSSDGDVSRRDAFEAPSSAGDIYEDAPWWESEDRWRQACPHCRADLSKVRKFVLADCPECRRSTPVWDLAVLAHAPGVRPFVLLGGLSPAMVLGVSWILAVVAPQSRELAFLALALGGFGFAGAPLLLFFWSAWIFRRMQDRCWARAAIVVTGVMLLVNAVIVMVGVVVFAGLLGL